ncbi:MAG TPA: hypothetical protein VH206_22475 [Xanthobacteraceae bacterium]|jgi:hypothetical protein|nr:hypothetical protein [Xanthobacteraceae bacterium]
MTGISTDTRPFCFIIPVWGASYCQKMVDRCLPSLLAANNFPLLNASDGHRFVIATTAEDCRQIEHLPVMARISRHVTISYIEIPTPEVAGYAGVIRHLSRCLKLLFDAAYADRSYCSFVMPEQIFSDGVVASMLRSVANGDHLLLATGLRQVEEDVLSDLANRNILTKDSALSMNAEALTISPRLIADLCVRYLHPEAIAYAESARSPIARPPFRFWLLGKERGLILRTFFAHPILMDFSVVPADHTRCLEQGDFESDYLGYAFAASARSGKIRVVTDSDECMILSPTPGSVDHTRDWLMFRRIGARLMPRLALIADIRNATLAYVRNYNDPVRLETFRNSVRWHAVDIDDAWQREEADIQDIVTQAAGDYYADPTRFPSRFRSNPRYWLIDAFSLAQYLLRYVYALQLVFAALAGNAEERLILKLRLSALASRYFSRGK